MNAPEGDYQEVINLRNCCHVGKMRFKMTIDENLMLR
jgi:hypothetical protein